MIPPTLDGQAVFGTCCKVQHLPQATAQQVSSFFGVHGTQALYGGTRGRSFTVSGVLTAEDPAGLRAAEALLQSYADGVPRTFIDTTGTSWPGVIYDGNFQPSEFRHIPGGGWALPYRLVLRGLI